MAKSLREIEATAGPAIHTKSVGVDGLTTEEQPQERKQPKTRKLTVIRPEATVEQEQPTEEQPQAEVEAPKPVLYKCSHHDARFPGEAQMLPLKAFPLRAEDGKRNGVYCKRCQSKMHTAYQQRRRGPHDQHRVPGGADRHEAGAVGRTRGAAASGVGAASGVAHSRHQARPA